VPTEFRDTIIRKIAQMKAELAALEAALAAYDRGGEEEVTGDSISIHGLKSNRFADVKPLFRAVNAVLQENGGKMSRTELIRELIDSGATIGKKRGIHNIRISIDTNIALGKLREKGQTIELVSNK
jgi:hypothetical protein